MPALKLKIRHAIIFPLLILGASLLLSGCFGPKTPQAVAKAFWQAVIAHDADAVVSYSTLSNPKSFDAFGLDWHGYTPVWGRVVIDGDQASIETHFTGPAGSQEGNRKCVTYLVRQKGDWKVDYPETAKDLHGGALGALFGSLGQMGHTLSKQLDASAKQFNAEMQRMGKKLQAMADSFSQQAEGVINKNAKRLQDIMRQLQDSINRALQDKHNHPSAHERQVMVNVADDLNASSNLLAHPSSKSLSACNDDMGAAQQQLNSIDSGVSDNYKTQWRALGRQFQAAMQQMLDEFANSVNHQNGAQ
jgi:gas vesicle protein